MSTTISASHVKELRDADRRGDDGLQARARGDGRRPRGRAHAPAREGHGPGGEARRPRDDRGHGRLRIDGDDAARWSPSAARRSRSRTTRSSSASRRACSRPCTRDGPEAPSSRSRRSASSSSRSSARTSSSSAPSASRPARARSSPPTSTRRRTRSASLVKLAGRQPGARAPAGDAHRVRARRSTLTARRGARRQRSSAEREIYSNSAELEGKPEQAKEKIVEGMLAEVVLRASRRLAHRADVDPRLGEDGAARRSGGGARVVAFAACSVAE